MNCKRKSLIIINEKTQYKMFKNYFNESKEIDSDIFNFDGIEAYEYIKSHGNDYDVIVLDVQLPKKDGISIINEFKDYNYILISQYNTKVLRTISSIIPTIQAVFIDPEYIQDIENAIKLVDLKEEVTNTQIDLKTTISKQLHLLGMPAHIKGYNYTRECIYQILTNKSRTFKITKDLYPLVAKEYGTTPSRVERAIRHSVEVCWNRTDYDEMELIFGNSVDFERSKPTNMEFISSVADAISLAEQKNKIISTKKVNYN